MQSSSHIVHTSTHLYYTVA